MIVATLVASALAQAAPPPAGVPSLEWGQAPDLASGDLGAAARYASGKQDGSKGSKGGNAKQDKSRWGYSPFFNPVGGASAYSNGSQTTYALSAGAAVGINFWDKKSNITGQTRLRAVLIYANEDFGADARIGAFAGPSEKYWRVWTGPDVFWNSFKAGGLNPTFGLDWPVTARLGPNEIHMTAGLIPTWVTNPDRRVDWDDYDFPGVGHEFEWRIGAVLNTGKIRGGLTYSHRYTVNGINNGFRVSVGI